MTSELSKLSTLFIAAGFIAGCSSQPDRLAIAPGAEGTFIAIGADLNGSISGAADDASTTFDFKRSAWNGLSIGFAAGAPYAISKDDAKPFLPASITKLVTTSLALKKLGPEFTFQTQVSYQAGSTSNAARDLTVVADGDPQVVKSISGDGVGQQRVFAEITEQLRKQGITRLEGSLVLVSADERHDLAIPADGMEESDHTTCFGAISQSFNYAWNCGELRVSGREAHWADSGLEFPLDLASNSGTASAISPIFGRVGSVVSFAVKDGARGSFSLPIANVKPWYGQTLRSVLSASGIDASAVSISMPTGTEARAVRASLSNDHAFVVMSEPLSSLVQFTNKPSDNFLADAIFKTIASKHGSGQDLRQEGQSAFNEAIARWLGSAGHSELASEIHLIDGAGLSHANHVTPRAYLALLSQLTHEPTFGALWDSLPIAGRDGTLKKRMNGTAADGLVRAKTGTLAGSYQLAGFVPRIEGGRVTAYVPFVILSAVTPGQRFSVYEFQAQLASKLAKLVNER